MTVTRGKKYAFVGIDIEFMNNVTVTLSMDDYIEEYIEIYRDLQGTKKIKRVIGMNGLNYIQTWIDASYAVHRDMRGHTGCVIILGTGTVMHNNCSKQKINTKSSTESEVVEASIFLLHTM